MMISSTLTLQFLGFVALLRLFYEILSFVYQFFFYRCSLEKYRRGDGREPWALVTSASDGIGLAFAQELCQRGFNVILHGRTEAKLFNVQKDLRLQFPSRSFRLLVLPALTVTPAEIKEAVSSSDLTSLNLVILVNNIGGLGDFISPQYMPLWDYTATQVDGLLNLNARFTTHLLHLLISQLVRNSPSFILNVSSVSSFGLPYVATYGATKAYINALSVGLASELRSEGHGDVDVMSLVLGSTRSVNNYHEELTEWYSLCDTRLAAKTALDRAGCGRIVIAGFWLHELQRRFLNMLPEAWRMALLARNMKPMKGMSFAQKKDL